MVRMTKEINPNILQTVFTNFLLNAAIKGWGEIEKNKEAFNNIIKPFEEVINKLKKRKNMSMDDLKTSYISLIEMYIKEISKINYDLDDIDNVIDLDSRR